MYGNVKHGMHTTYSTEMHVKGENHLHGRQEKGKLLSHNLTVLPCLTVTPSFLHHGYSPPAKRNQGLGVQPRVCSAEVVRDESRQ